MSLFEQPKPVYLLSFVELWNRFSHFGMKALLVLFMVKALEFSDAAAFGVFAVFSALDKLGGIFGAYLAEKIFGLKRSILLGGWIIAFGHLSLACKAFFPGLSLLILGSSLFTTNIIALVGHFYPSKDEKRTSGFTLFYMAINVGALLATILCGVLAEQLGWEYGFGLAAIGMVIGNIALMKYGYLLEDKGDPPQKSNNRFFVVPILLGGALFAWFALYKQAFALPLLPWIAFTGFYLIFRKIDYKKISPREIAVPLIAYIFFNLAESQVPSSLVLLADRVSSHTLFGIPMTTTSILTLNPIVIITLGGLATFLHRKLKYPFLHLFFPFAFAALGFSILVLLPKVPFLTLMLVVGMISFAEIFVIPTAYSALSKTSVETNDPKVMALIPLGYAIASLGGGGVGKLIAHSGYDLGFGLLAGFLLLGGFALGFQKRGAVKT